MSEINYKELREAAKQATQDEWVAYILPGHNGIYPARTSEGRHCGYFIDWPSVCQGRESINMSIRTYAVNCNDAWLNTEGDDISGSYVKYKDHQEVVAALEAKCAALAAENAGLKAICDDRRRFIMNGVQTGYIKVPTAETAPDLETIRIAISPQKPIPATDAFLAEVKTEARKEGAYFVANRMLAAWEAGFIDDTAKNAADIARMILTSTEFMANAPEGDFDRSFSDGVLEDIAAQLRKGGNQ
ncbi:TPA: ead/Ea22-like family protein [Escherichia coli]|uniref:ead/Ea22-like family protein n=1 Tax=Escherichia coli TaxID=562 RepID=UPI000E20B691|nr:ead/Ea22-like family protein [Escherichia coli]MBV4884296.1 ead/Ea22-like family protein [Escherichia coli]MCE3885954.1 ead/Ea22-like family protein [Escherichia coli]MDE8004916.1 ead/Ea22-like family protein [Escherichia coli]MDG5932285.1 ead/Ea22-like family protein [Escherichia coli]HCU3286027.1 ead/Ea22-like family protein [Escherichia coli]